MVPALPAASGRALRSSGLIVALFLVASAACSDDPDDTATDVDIAISYWEAVEQRDLAAALTTVESTLHDSDEVAGIGRADNLADQFRWYEAVEWTWTLESCQEESEGIVCVAHARNAWSDALGVEPVAGSFAMQVSEGKVIAVEERYASFIGHWGPKVFKFFDEWVQANHPEDAVIMFSEEPVNDEILELYETNTTRFVDSR